MADLAVADRTSEVTNFSAAARWTGVMSNEREKWLALRRTVLTASDMAAVLGYDPHRDAFDVFVDKTTERQEPELITLDDPRFWGNVLEQPVLRAVAEYHGWDYRPGGALLVSREHPWLGATLDAEVNRGAGWLDLEGKTTRVPAGWNQEEEQLPIRVLCQVQTQILVAKPLLGCVFALLQGSRPCQIDVEPHAELHAVMLEVGEEFMGRVARLLPPEPTDKSERTLNRLFPKDKGGIVPLPLEAIDWTTEMRELQELVKTTDRRITELKNKLKACIGEATFGELPHAVDGKKFWRWQQQTAKAYTVEEKTYRALLQIKNAEGADRAPKLPPPVPTVVPSNDTETAAEVIRLRTKRRQSRR